MNAPNIQMLSSSLLSSKTEKIMTIKNDFENELRAQQKTFERSNRAWNVYTALDGSQYEHKKLRIFNEEDRKPWQFDFVSAKADTLAGTIISELPDPEWDPVFSYKTSLTEAMQETYIRDKELFNYSNVLLQTIRDGCVHGGWCEIGESKKYNPAGNISLTHIRPGYFVPESYWLSDDDMELMVAYKIGYFNAIRMKQIWKKTGYDIDKAVYEAKRGKKEIIPEDRLDKQQRFETNVGDEWRVIEKHYLEIKDMIRLVGLRKDAEILSQKLSWIPFPVTEDREYLEKFGDINNIDWETVQEMPFEKRTHKVCTITDLSNDIILEDGISNVQCNALPFLHYTTTRINGRDKGIVETIADLQEMFNERMSHVHELIGKASGGSTLYNEDLWKNPKERQNFAKKSNKPGHKEFVDLDGVKNIKEEIDSIQVNPAIFQQVSIIYNELLPLISRVSDTMSAMSKSEDTGVLFEKKYQMNKLSNILFEKFAKQLINNLGERYYYQFQKTYSGARREIKARNGNIIVLNERTENGIINNVEFMPRCNVTVNENFSSPTYRMRQRMQIQDIIKNIPENDYLRMNSAMGMFFDTIPMSDKDKAEQKMVTEKNNIKATMQFMSEISNFQAGMANNEVMVKQAEVMLMRMQQGMEQQQQQPVPQQMTEQSEMAVSVNG